MVENSRAGRKKRKRGSRQLGNRVSNGVDLEMHRICVDFCPSWGCSLRGGNFMIWGRQLWPGTSLSWTAQAVGTHMKFLTSRGTPMGISGIWAEKEQTSPEWIAACSHYGGAVATQSKRLTHVHNCQNNFRILNYGLFLWVGRIWGEKWKIFFTNLEIGRMDRCFTDEVRIERKWGVDVVRIKYMECDRKMDFQTQMLNFKSHLNCN